MEKESKPKSEDKDYIPIFDDKFDPTLLKSGRKSRKSRKCRASPSWKNLFNPGTPNAEDFDSDTDSS